MNTSISLGVAFAGALALSSLAVAASNTWSPPRTPDGRPELAGVWSGTAW